MWIISQGLYAWLHRYQYEHYFAATQTVFALSPGMLKNFHSDCYSICGNYFLEVPETPTRDNCHSCCDSHHPHKFSHEEKIVDV
jgi:hypothetical protein